jgi:hypothetical protein
VRCPAPVSVREMRGVGGGLQTTDIRPQTTDREESRIQNPASFAKATEAMESRMRAGGEGGGMVDGGRWEGQTRWMRTGVAPICDRRGWGRVEQKEGKVAKGMWDFTADFH